MDILGAGISPLTDLIGFLQKKSVTNDVHKKQLIMELRNNLNVFANGFLNETSHDMMIDLLCNDAIQQAVKEHFSFKKLHAGTIQAQHVHDDRNKKYIGWNAERIVDKIDEKIVELRNLKKMNGGSLIHIKNNTSLMMTNLYFRMKLLADFIRS